MPTPKFSLGDEVIIRSPGSVWDGRDGEVVAYKTMAGLDWYMISMDNAVPTWFQEKELEEPPKALPAAAHIMHAGVMFSSGDRVTHVSCPNFRCCEVGNSGIITTIYLYFTPASLGKGVWMADVRFDSGAVKPCEISSLAHMPNTPAVNTPSPVNNTSGCNPPSVPLVFGTIPATSFGNMYDPKVEESLKKSLDGMSEALGKCQDPIAAPKSTICPCGIARVDCDYHR